MKLWLRIVLICVGIFIIVLAVLFGAKSQTESFLLHWSYYPEYGDSDVVKLRLYEVTVDSVIKKVILDSINVQWTTHAFSIQKDDQQHYFTMTAIDSSNNESKFSNFAVLDLSRPIPVKDVYITH